MRRFLIAAFIALILPVGCTPAKTSAISAHMNDEAYLLRHVASGSDDAKFYLGVYYCGQPAKDSGAKAAKWWRESAQSSDSSLSMQSNQELGSYYASLYDGTMGNELVNYDPSKKHPPAQYCTGATRSAENDAKAIKYFTACTAEPIGLGDDCNLALGHIFYNQKKYEQAYFWYGTIMFEDIDNGKKGFMPEDYKGPLLSGPRENNAKGIFDKNTHFRFAGMAARHLTKKQIAEIDAKIRARYAARWDRQWSEITSASDPNGFRE